MVDSNMTQWPAWQLRAVTLAAKRSHGAHRGFVELDDLMQEGFLWVLQHPLKVSEWGEYDEDNGGREGFAQLQQSVYHHLHTYTMKERYRKDGTRPEDYYTYRLAVIIELLPEALNGEPNYGSSATDVNTLVKSGKSPAEGGDRMAMIADVQAGLAALNERELELITAKYAQETTSNEELAQWFEMPEATVNRHVGRALKKIARKLGSEPVRKRRVISNAQAQHITREQE